MKGLKFLFFLPLLLTSHVAFSEGEHCLQRSFSEFGNTETCIKNISLSKQDFKQVCQPKDSDYVQFTAKYISSCPANYKGVCKGLKTQSGHNLPYLSYIYENDISFMQSSCEANGGKWEVGDA
ncbi:hypothetical protein [uncultured Psychrosphaera sp.]|uniref:hypothetical protein n=1 Tax=uncultured Psychrosphaera sp. TaxID=1403522 RepID=UPI0030FB453B